jgi:hypothetical protein
MASKGQMTGMLGTYLHEAALYITKLPKAEHDVPEWLVAMEALTPHRTIFAHGVGFFVRVNAR